MALADYETQVLALIQAPSSPIPLVDTATLTTYINMSRMQVAGQGLCIRNYAQLVLVAGTQQYPFSAITGLSSGVNGIFNIRQAWCNDPGTSGQAWISPRPFEYFGYFFLNDAVPPTGQPTDWSQFGQGEGGSIFVYPTPDQAYTLNLDVVGVPINLSDDSTPEVIPALWTQAVPFYAAWLAFLSLQRAGDGANMRKLFEEQMALARHAANPDIQIEAWSQSQHPTMANQLGAPAGSGG